MLAATTPTKIFASPYDSAISPSHSHRRTPSRRASEAVLSFDSPMLTPSPLRKHSTFSSKWSGNIGNSDDLFLQSPYKSPAQAHRLLRTPAYTSKPMPIQADDDEGRIFLSSNSNSFTPFFASTNSQPLTTPVKGPQQSQSRRPGLSERNLNRPRSMLPPTFDDTFSTRTSTGVKRKSTPLFTPLKIDTSGSFGKLAPLPALNLTQRPAASGAETAASLTRLKLNDPLNPSVDADDDWDEPLESPGVKSLFKSDKAACLKGKARAEVAELSPGGHVTKRRAKLAVSAGHGAFESPSPVKKSVLTRTRPRHSAPVAFPSSNAYRSRASPGSSSSEAGSPAPRRRISITSRPYIKAPVFASRPPMSRQDNLSAATLFFGPTIPQSPPVRNRTSTDSPLPEFKADRHKTTNRHSYAGTSTSGDWAHVPRERVASSLPVDPTGCISTDIEDDDMDFEGPAHTSFTYSLTGGTPSPTVKRPLPLKSESVKDKVNLLMPGASSSSSSLCSDDGLITPLTHVSSTPAWPGPKVHDRDSDDHRARFTDEETDADVESFIVRTLAAGGKGPGPGGKKPPGTPVKKARIAFLGTDRPWQSAISAKIGFNEEGPKKKVPRKSMPAAFLPKGSTGKSLLDQSSDTEDEEDSPSGKKDGKYTKLGLGHPTTLFSAPFANPKTRWLMRRSSSGAFSSGSESTSQANTPTRPKNTDWQLPKLSVNLSPPGALPKATERTTSGSSSSSGVISSPTNRKAGPGHGTGARIGRISVINRRLSEPFAVGQAGRFERDFEVVDELGSGEFGSVIKARSNHSGDNKMYAIKRSKRFEGLKHRLRLWEEVEVLKHLAEGAERSGFNGGHPNVLAHIDSWEEEEVLFIQTELCESGNLARFLWEYGKVFPRLDEARVWKIVADLIDGLSFIHDSGVIHLDLKPSNVFLTHEGRFKIGDFGMASLWPRKPCLEEEEGTSFEREGDKLYLAPEVLQGVYSRAADVFSFGMTILETATNIVVPDQGESWHRLRREDFCEVKWEAGDELLELIKQTMRTDPEERLTAKDVYNHPVVTRTRRRMEEAYQRAKADGTNVFAASPLASVPRGFLEEILGESDAMDVS